MPTTLARGTTALLLTLTFTACGDARRPDPAPAAGTPADALSPAGASAIALLAGGDTVAVESFDRGDSHLQGELRDRDSGVRAQYVAELADDGRIARLEISVFRGADPMPERQASLSIDRDTLVAEQRDRNGEATLDRLALPPGTQLYLNPSMGMLEYLLQRAGDDSTMDVLQVSLTERPQLVRATVTRSAGVVELRTADTHVRLDVDEAGRILAGTTAGEVEVRRVQ